MDWEEEESRKTQPRKRANFFSKILFLFTLKLFWKTYKTKSLKKRDLFGVLDSQNAKDLGDKLENYWRAESKKSKKPSIYRVLISCYGSQYMFLGLVQLFMRTLVVVMIPKTLASLLAYFQPNQNSLTRTDAIVLTIVLITLNVINVAYLQNYLLQLSALGIKIRTAFSSLIYRKCLRLTPGVVNKGNMINLLTKDVAVFENIVFYGNDIWIGFAQAGIVCYLIYRKIGLVSFIGVGIFIVIIPVQICLGKLTSKFRLNSSQKTDERLGKLQEILSHISYVKVCCWENLFQEKLMKIRREEVKYLVKMFLVKVSTLLIGGLTSKLAFFALILFHLVVFQSGTSLVKDATSAELIYYILTLFQRIRHALSVLIPKGIIEFAELSASIRRIENVLNLQTPKNPVKNLGNMHRDPYLKLVNLTVKIDDKIIINKINASFDVGLNVIVGNAGSGKSTLLKTILGNYELNSGSLLGNGTMSYASQEPWIFPSTVRQNIIFGEEFDENRYEQVIKSCALDLDVKLFKNGDELIVGDKGSALSRGQKSRINLARAVYKNADIYLIDDCFSDLDPQVQQQIFAKCLKTFLKDKIVIFTTGNAKFATNSDEAFALENSEITTGKIVENVEESSENVNEETTLIKNGKTNCKDVYGNSKRSGKVKFEIYKSYINHGGGIIAFSVIITFFSLTHLTRSYSDKLVSNWINLEQNLTRPDDIFTTRTAITTIYSIVVIMSIFLAILTSFILFNFSRKASNNLHDLIVNNLLEAKMTFFDKTYLGNILNRFSKDFVIVDEILPFVVYDFLEIFFGLCGVTFLILLVNKTFIFPMIFMFLILYFIRKLYIPTGRNLQRLDIATRNPIIGYLNASLEGLTTIQALNAQNLLVKEFSKHQDLHTSASYISICCTRAFALFLDLTCMIFIAVLIFAFIFIDTGTPVGDIGLAITQAFTLSGLVQYGIRLLSDVETKMTSVERILEYADVEKEVKFGGDLPSNWPKSGKIKYDNVSMFYPKSNGLVLKNLNFTINAGEKVGIVGRTGAGKSSLTSTLTKLYDFEGTITIDDVNINNINLNYLRRNIVTIPQDFSLFSGTIRDNVDPEGRHLDDKIWSVLEKLKLKEKIENLNAKIDKFSFSVSEKKLVSISRAMLEKSKVLILDEVNANMDEEFEESFMKIVEECFEKCTVLKIAHKLESVLSCDKIIVMSSGELVQFDTPENLLKDKNGRFYEIFKS